MSEIQNISVAPSIFTSGAPVAENVDVVPAEHLLEADVVTNNIPRLTTGRQAQTGAAVSASRTPATQNTARSKKSARGVNQTQGTPHPLLPDPDEHHGLHDVTTVAVAPMHENETKALDLNALALTLRGLSPRDQAQMVRILNAKQAVQSKRKAATERAAPTGRARLRAPGLRNSQLHPIDADHDDLPEIADHDAIDVLAPRHQPIAPTLQNQGADPRVALMERQLALENTSNITLHMSNPSIADRSASPKISAPRTPFEHVMQQAATIDERERHLNQMVKANSVIVTDAAHQAAQFEQWCEMKPMTHKLLGQLIRSVDSVRDEGARGRGIVALIGKLHKGQPGYIRELSAQLATVRDPELQQAGFRKLQELLDQSRDAPPAA